MAQNTKIEWTGRSWNPVRGCSRVSEGCRNCYAEGMAARFNQPGNWGHGLAVYKAGKPRWTGRVEAAPIEVLFAPLKWKKPGFVFVNSTSDLFHEDLPDALIDRVFAVMALCPHLTFQVLTKRPERMRAYMARKNPNGHHPAMDYAALMAATGYWNTPSLELRNWPLPNVWLGTSIEDQPTADVRLSYLRETLAAVRFVSAEPLLLPVDLTAWLQDLDWVICGGESGPGARPMHPDWVRSLRDQCAAAGVPFFFKQWGNHIVVYDRDRDDPDWRRCTEVERATPNGRWLNLDGGHGFHGERVVRVKRTKKSAAGRLLDGVLHDAMPGGGA